MPRMMSFAMTKEQVYAELKDVTRRLGWGFLKPGHVVEAVEKAQGLKKGQKVVRIRMIEIVSTRWEPLNIITQSECVREGFPEMTPGDFIAMFCKANGCEPDKLVNRIEFKYL